MPGRAPAKSSRAGNSARLRGRVDEGRRAFGVAGHLDGRRLGGPINVPSRLKLKLKVTLAFPASAGGVSILDGIATSVMVLERRGARWADKTCRHHTRNRKFGNTFIAKPSSH